MTCFQIFYQRFVHCVERLGEMSKFVHISKNIQGEIFIQLRKIDPAAQSFYTRVKTKWVAFYLTIDIWIEGA